MNFADTANVSRGQIVDFIQGKAWAITPSALESIQRVLMKCEGDIVNLSQLRASMLQGGVDDSARRAYKVEDGKAIIPIIGPLDKRASFWQLIFGGSSTEQVQKAIEKAIADPSVHGLVLNIDSPGGTVDGIKDLADFIYESRGKKPIVAYVDGSALSAAYWIASAADKVVTSKTSSVGSIGVWTSHMDASKLYENLGVKKTYIYAGKYKVAGHEAAPLSGEDKDYMQGFVDKYYTLFVEDVARNRGVGVKKVVKDMAEGRIFIGSDALDAGLVDKLGSYKVALNLAGRQGQKARAEGLDAKELITSWGAAHGFKTGKDSPDSVKAELRSQREARGKSTCWDEQEFLAEAKEAYGDSFESHFRGWYGVRKNNTQQTKEEKVMDFHEFKATYPEHYKAAKQEGVDTCKAGDEFMGMAAAVKALEGKVGTLEASNRGIEKQLALSQEKLVGVAADQEMNRILASSSVPERLHAKVKKQVDYRSFIKDGEGFEAGSESFKTFAAAFAAEVADWEKEVTGKGNSGLGAGAGKVDGGDGTDEERLVAYGKRVAKEAMGHGNTEASKK